MRDKLDGLGFLDHRVAPIVSTIDDLLVRIPTKGAIEGSILQEILATAMLLSDPDKTRRHGEGLLTAQPPVVDQAELDEIIDDDQPDSPTASTATTVATEPTLVIAESVSDSPDFTDLFDGIFDDELEAESASASDDCALEVLLDKSQAEQVTNNDAARNKHSENAAEPATVTAGDDGETDDSDQDYWF
jgi:hypothetical protein